MLQGPFVAAFASTNLGDVSPNTRGPKCEFSGNDCSAQYTCPGRKEMCFASGPGDDMFASTSIIAHKIFDEAWVSFGYNFLLLEVCNMNNNFKRSVLRIWMMKEFPVKLSIINNPWLTFLQFHYKPYSVCYFFNCT